jgi:hypothetical protein
MSVSTLFSPNNFNLFANSITANNLVFDDTSIDNLQVNSITELVTDSGVNIQGIGFNDNNTINFPSIPTAGLMLPNVGGSPSLLNFYEEATLTTTLINLWTVPPAATIKCIRIGKLVSLTVANTTKTVDTSANTINLGTLISSEFRPSANVNEAILVTNNNNLVDGYIVITTGGNFQINIVPTPTAPGTPIPFTGIAGVPALSFTYNLN